MKHKSDAMQRAQAMIDAHTEHGLDNRQATIAAMVTAEKSNIHDSSLSQRTINYLRELVYGPVTAHLIHDKEQELQRAYGSRGFEYSMPDNEDEMTDDEIEEEYDLQKEAYTNKIANLKIELADLKKLVSI